MTDSVLSCAEETDIEVLGVVKTAPPENSMPLFRPFTARPTIATRVISIDRPYQILRLTDEVVGDLATVQAVAEIAEP